MNTPNFALMEHHAQERRQAILRQAQQEQQLSSAKPTIRKRSTLRRGSSWLSTTLATLYTAMRNNFEKRVVVRSSAS